MIVVEGDLEESFVVVLWIRRDKDEGVARRVFVEGHVRVGGGIGGEGVGEGVEGGAGRSHLGGAGGDFRGGSGLDEFGVALDHLEEELLQLVALLLSPGLEGVVRVKVLAASGESSTLSEIVDADFEVVECGLPPHHQYHTRLQ